MGNNSHLTVYKASAGSGKTFRLAVQYITMLVNDPEDYRHINSESSRSFMASATASRILRAITRRLRKQ